MRRSTLSGVVLLSLACAGIHPAPGPTIRVVLSLPNLSPVGVEQQLVLPTEAALAQLPGVQTIVADSVVGSTTLQARFADGIRPDDAALAVRAALDPLPLPEGTLSTLHQTPAPAQTRLWLLGPDRSVLFDIAAALEQTLATSPHVHTVRSSVEWTTEYQVHIDPDRAAAHALSTATIQASIQAQGATDLDALMALTIQTPAGFLPLSDLAQIQYLRVPTRLSRRDRQPAVWLEVETPQPEALLDRSALPPGVTLILD